MNALKWRSNVLPLLLLLSGTTACRAQEALEWTYRLGFRGVMVDAGLEVRHIDPQSPVLNMRSIARPGVQGIMDIGDVIIDVDGEPVDSLAEYYALMNASRERGGAVVITVLDVRNGQRAKWQVQGRLVQVPQSPEGEGGTTPSELRRAHFLLIADTFDPGVGAGEKDNLAAWHKLAMSVTGDRLGSVRVIEGADCNPPKILSTIRELNVPSRDTLFCFYGGHGAHDVNLAPGHRSGGHYLAILDRQGQSQILMRKSITDALEAKGARLAVLVTDTCNVSQPVFPAEAVVSELRAMTVYGLSPFEQLLFDYQGIVDIGGTDFGEYGFCEPGIGGWFSYAAIPVLERESDWNNAFERMRISANNFYQERKAYWKTPPRILQPNVLALLNNQATMLPKSFLINVRRQVAAYGPVASAPRTVTYEVRKSVGLIAAPPP